MHPLGSMKFMLEIDLVGRSIYIYMLMIGDVQNGERPTFRTSKVI